jgi:hypothetical protein
MARTSQGTGPGVSSGYVFPSGGGGGGASSDIEWELVDLTDGSWTVSDPAGWIASVSKVSDAMLFTNAAVSGNTDHDPVSGANFDAYRAYKALTYPDGTAVTTSDVGVLTTSMKWLAPTGTGQQQYLTVGMSVAPASTVRNTILFAGAIQYQQSTTIKQMGAVRTTGATISGTGTPTGVIAYANLANARYGFVGYSNFDAAGAGVYGNSLINNVALTAGQPLYITVQCGSRTTTAATAGRTQKAELRYAIRSQTAHY